MDTVTGTREIQDLRLRDDVVAYDRNGELVPGEVVSLFTHANRECVEVDVEARGPMVCTLEHPFKVPGGPDEFTPAGQLKEGDILLSMDGSPLKILSVRPAGFHDVHNIEVATVNTYIANGVRVHNADKG